MPNPLTNLARSLFGGTAASSTTHVPRVPTVGPPRALPGTTGALPLAHRGLRAEDAQITINKIVSMRPLTGTYTAQHSAFEPPSNEGGQHS
jgi:hypothetical protein